MRTLYRYIDSNVLAIKNIDLIRKVRYKIRKSHKEVSFVPRKCFINRTYDDFTKYLEFNSALNVVELDTVHGILDGKVIFTMLFRNCSLLVAFLIDSSDSASTADVFQMLYRSLKPELFHTLFPILLSDRGPEFSSPEALELNCTEDTGLTRMFYCDPNSPVQKGHLENTHEYIRRVLPKKKSFNNLTQEDITLMINHINSTAKQTYTHAKSIGFISKMGRT